MSKRFWEDDDALQDWIRMNTKRQFEHSLQSNILCDYIPEDDIIEDHTPDVTMHQDVFNVGCARYMDIETMYNNLGYGSVLVYAPTRDGWDQPEEYNPWDNMTLLTEVMEKVLENDDLAEDDYDLVPEMVLDGFQNTWRNVITDIVISDEERREQTWAMVGGTDESDEIKFNRLCKQIKLTWELDGYCLDTSTFSPYRNSQQLMRIVETVVANSGQPFVVRSPYAGRLDMMSEMREYVETYSGEQHLPEIYMKSY